MEVFPTTPAPSYPFGLVPQWRTLSSDLESGSEQRRQKWLYAKYDVTLHYESLSEANAKTLYEFYMARKGSFEAFYFYDLYSFNHTGIYIATGDGSTDVFDIPGVTTSARTLYVDGVETTTGVSYLTGGGDGSADRVDFTTAPASGEIITIDFTGFLRVKCKFKNDNLSRENFMTTLFRNGLEFKGVK